MATPSCTIGHSIRSIAQVGQLVCNYYYTADPVSSFEAYLYDLGTMITTERSRTAWVKQLRPFGYAPA